MRRELTMSLLLLFFEGWALYLLDWSNYIDMVMVVNFMSLMLIRFTATECSLNENVDDPQCWDYHEHPKFLYYRACWSFNSVLIWVRRNIFSPSRKVPINSTRSKIFQVRETSFLMQR